MAYKQLHKPNLAIAGVIGDCLIYARQMFGIPSKYYYASLAWSGAKYKHRNRSLPNDVAVPMFYSYEQGGIEKGHVTVNVPGHGIYSSPYQRGTSHAVMSSIAEVEKHYGVKYLGWTEDLNGVRVVEPVAAAPASKHPLAKYVGKTVSLAKAAKTWNVYKVGSVSPRKAVATLNCSKYGPLRYVIEATDKSLNSVVITTRDFGRVSLPIAQDNKGTLYKTASIK